MNQLDAFILANELSAQLTKEAALKRSSAMMSRIAELAAPAMAKAQPVLDKGFMRLGQAAEGIKNPMLSKLLTGAGPNTGAMAGYAGQAAGELGRTVAKRVGIGAGGLYGGAVAAEAPFKMRNNAAYNDQQQHPIRSWLLQHLAGRPKLQSKSYLNPLSI